jgi:membrane protein implicated in regulation of membrane protease activity
MRIRTLPVVLAAMLFAALTVVPAFAAEAPIPKNDPTSGQLVEKPKDYNGKTVTFTGEAIGEVMVRGDYAWIHLNDDAYMELNVEEGATLGGYNSGMAVWVPSPLTVPIDTYGDYKHEGSIVQISGTFNAACKEHGGDMDIHATKLSVVRVGHVVADPIPPWKAALAAALVALAAVLFWIERRTRNRITPHRGV